MSEGGGDSSNHTIVAGYGLPGRAVAEYLAHKNRSYCVIELNAATVHRCDKAHVPMIVGDCRDPEVLKQAGIERAAALLIMIPDEKAALEATVQARKLNPNVRIITRLHYVSAGIEARARGANDVIVAEQLVAEEVYRRLNAEFKGGFFNH